MKRLILFSLTLMLAAPIFAQSQITPRDSAEWWRGVSKQTHDLLDSPIAEIRAQALKNSIYLAKFHAEDVSLNGSVRRIIKLYERDEDASVRKLALAALESIGSKRARAYMEANVPQEMAAKTNELIASVLDEYSGRTTTL